MSEESERLQAKRDFVARQTAEASTTGNVTLRNGQILPVWAAFRCLYCGEYYNQSTAEEHFGQTRAEHNSKE